MPTVFFPGSMVGSYPSRYSAALLRKNARFAATSSRLTARRTRAGRSSEKPRNAVPSGSPPACNSSRASSAAPTAPDTANHGDTVSASP